MKLILSIFKLKSRQLNLVLLISSLCAQSIFAQNIITTTAYLNSTNESYQVKTDKDKLSFLNEYNFNLPLIKGAQIRSETNDFLLRKQEYSLRVKPNSLRAISNQKKVYRNKIERIEIQNQLNFNKELKKRYLLLIDYLYTKDLIKLYEEKYVQIKDKITVLSQTIYDINFDVNDLIDTEEELIAIESKLTNLKEDRFNQLYLIRQFLNFTGESVNFDFDDLISAERIIEMSIIKKPTFENLSISLQKVKLNTLESEMSLNAAKSNQLIDYFQAKYNSSKNFVFEENFSAGIGINLPFFGGTRQKKGKYYFEKLSGESKLISIRRDVQDEQKLMFNEFKSAITNYQDLQKQIANSNINSIIEIYKNMEGVSPLIVLKLNILQNRKKIKTLKSQHNLFRTYIKTLDSKGILYQKPLKNYLSLDWKLLIP